MTRNNSIDIAKGIGIFIIVWGHCVCPIKSELSIFNIPLFFILSGYVFNINDSFNITLIKKLNSLGKPLVFFFIFQRIGFITVSILGNNFDRHYLLPWYSIPPWQIIGALWFFLSLFTVTLSYCIINKIESEKLKFLFCFISTFAGFLLDKYHIHIPLYIGSSLSMMLFFYIGIALNKYRFVEAIQSKFNIIMGLLSISIFVLCLDLYKPSIIIAFNTFEGNFFLSLGIMLLGSFMVLLNSKLIDKISYVNKVLGYIGRNSLAIFGTHTVILEALYLIKSRNKVNNSEGILLSVLTLGICLILNLIFQKYFPFIFNKTNYGSQLISRFLQIKKLRTNH